ncbi:spore coat putative kinase YutH [Saccharococcus caldoxylosilyticus]|uniref:spore coat putative kinase YutH n=1 Tax=Saccharococcus caldoxylosilyticus TaxID=81408 RepID=UPI0002DDB829|nr:spore coat protein YutH [Parageobacillus caldoxylosilyticus]
MESWIRQEYDIEAERMKKNGRYYTFLYKHQYYTVIPVYGRSEAELEELQKMSNYLISKGDMTVASFVQTKSGKLVAYRNEQPIVIVRTPLLPYARNISVGRELAKFHQRGRTCPLPLVHCRRIGQWKELWGKRVDQMEEFWKNKIAMGMETMFDRLLIESFPYYLALAENAIQYVADTELDEEPFGIDYATFCHERIPNSGWVEGKEQKLPTDWVYDHCARDLAEWVRYLYVKKGHHSVGEIRQFFRDYERQTPLSPFAWRLVYARLLFPLHYFECVEGYYMSDDEREKQQYVYMLQSIIARSREHEQFLASFMDIVGLSSRHLSLPKVEWLSYSLSR